MIRGSKSRTGDAETPQPASNDGESDTGDDPPEQGIPQGSPTLKAAEGIALERGRWDEIERYIAAELLEEASS